MNEEKQIQIPCFLTVLLSILIDKLSINYIKAETHQTKLNSSICALFETIPQREFIETGYDPTASNRSRICSTTSNDNNIIQSDAEIDPEKTAGKGLCYAIVYVFYSLSIVNKYTVFPHIVSSLE